MGRKTIELEVRSERLRLRDGLRMRSIVQVSGHRLHNILDNPLPCQKKAVPLHRDFIGDGIANESFNPGQRLYVR